MNGLASGSWLGRERVLRVAIVFGLASLVSLAWLFSGSGATLDPLGRPLGTDFSNVWTAGRMALDGRPAEIWSWPAHFEFQRQFHGKADVDLFGWHYPPPFLLVAAALAALPYVAALIVWQAATLSALLLVMTRIVPRRETVLLLLAAPVTLICLTHGHNGFLTAALLAGGIALLSRRPFVAGLLFGCLIYKPQLALVLPPLLLVTRNWTAIAGACLSAILIVAATLSLWGWPVWQAFIDSLPLTRTIVLEQGSTGWHKIMSPFSAVRMWDGTIPMAYGVQSAATLAAILAVVRLSLLRGCADLRNAAVCAAALLSTPYVMDYDQVVLLPALAWLWRDGRRSGFLPWDKTLMAFAWAVPILARTAAEIAFVPLGLSTTLVVLAIAVRRGEVRASPSRRSHEAFAR